MHVTNVRVSFLREKQPAQYEKAAPSVEFSAVLDEGDDHRVVARVLMIDATAVVYAGIGYEVPDRVAAVLLDGKVPAEVAVEVKTGKAAERAPLTAEKATADGREVPTSRAVEEAEVAEATPKKKKVGRPKGSRNTRPKAGTKAAEDAAGGLVKAVTASDIPGNNDIPGDPARVGPEDDPKDHGVEAKKFTARDLHTMIIDLINTKPPKLSLASAKQILAHFQVARAQDLTPEQVIEGKAMVEKMVEASAK